METKNRNKKGEIRNPPMYYGTTVKCTRSHIAKYFNTLHFVLNYAQSCVKVLVLTKTYGTHC